ncbi:Protein of unknown function [Chitinophaga rupis]|uniref:DUF3347 domain-containing protein n=1 Tax=Chitinophaga rupis TaxID=573321 RepID=A0A1H7RBY2_9BACT|nr:DUF3347 domain-containing protein [Chitinophaga rupis]SEL56957.1 Protein of unknown function [Chitinophaga rupis]
MKYIILIAAITFTFLIACNSGNKQPNTTNDAAQPTPASNSAEQQAINTKPSSSVNGIINGYLDMKNALANDDGNGAATAGNTMVEAFEKFDKSALTTKQKATYEDIEDDAREHAEHIGKNGSNIKHQREHFDMLSKDIYQLAKTIGGGVTLYYDHCLMYNNNKGADWISETKEIANPYLGKSMPTCGSVKEELK